MNECVIVITFDIGHIHIFIFCMRVLVPSDSMSTSSPQGTAVEECLDDWTHHRVTLLGCFGLQAQVHGQVLGAEGTVRVVLLTRDKKRK